MYCQSCGQPLQSGSRFCNNCGAQLPNQQQGAQISPPPVAAGAYQMPPAMVHAPAPKRNRLVKWLVGIGGTVAVLGLLFGLYTVLRMGKAKEVALVYVQALQAGDRDKVCSMHVYRPWCDEDLARFRSKYGDAQELRAVKATPNGFSETRGLQYYVVVEFKKGGSVQSITVPVYPDSKTPASVFFPN